MWILSNHSKQLALAHSQLELELLHRTAELQTLTQRLLKVQDEERRKLARDLHDSTGQTLVALKISASFLKEHCKPEPAAIAAVEEVVGMVDQAIDEIRTMSYLLHPPLLDEVGFTCAAEWYIEGFAKRCGVQVNMNFALIQDRLPIAVEIALFRVLQESLTNVHRHSGAVQVDIAFTRMSDRMILQIRDYGCGISKETLAALRQNGGGVGVGLAGMRERMIELNGSLEIESSPYGTTMRASVPLFEIASPLEVKRPSQDFLSLPVQPSGLVDGQGRLVHETWNQSSVHNVDGKFCTG